MIDRSQFQITTRAHEMELEQMEAEAERERTESLSAEKARNEAARKVTTDAIAIRAESERLDKRLAVARREKEGVESQLRGAAWGRSDDLQKRQAELSAEITASEKRRQDLDKHWARLTRGGAS